MPRKLIDKAESRAKRSELSKLAERFAAFRPAHEVLKVVRAVPTRFPYVDFGTRVGGWPIERFTLVHGPSNEGKSLFTLGLVDSFLARDHLALYVDAERTTPITWVDQLMGVRSRHPRFFAMRPSSYEDTIGSVRNFLNLLIAARKEREVEPDTSALVVVDSLRKLVPKDLLKEILALVKEEVEEAAAAKKGRFGKKKGITTGKDRRAQIQAKMNAAWMDELVPLLEASEAGLVAIAREMTDPDADQWAKERGEDYKVGGGGAIYYDASLVVRVERESWITNGESGEAREVYGERHMALIRKTKIGDKDDKVTETFFHSSNGRLVPFGFDRARDVLELAKQFEVVTQKRASFAWGGTSLGQGEHNVVKRLTDSSDLLEGIEAEVRSMFKIRTPRQWDPETGEVTT